MVGQGDLSEASWRKSKRSGSDGTGSCVSVAAVGSCGAVRDSKDPELTTIVVSMAALRRLLQEIKRGDLDLR
jgi:hypothetical protein